MFEQGALVQNYRIVRKLGEGGMGVVYAAEHVILGRPAAVKVLHPWAAQDAEVAQRFINEARIAANLDHDNIVGVQDCGQLATGEWFIALDLLVGESLRDFLARQAGRSFDLFLIVHILGEAAAGLHAAHERGIVHRDVKPDNIFLTKTPHDPYRAINLDFGIAKLKDPGAARTRDRVIMGTLAYMAPEQVIHGAASVDRRADVFALAMIAYEMATGRNPLAHLEGVTQTVAFHQAQTRAPDPRTFRPDLPKAFAKAMLRGVEPDPARRFPDMRAMMQAFAMAATSTSWSGNAMSLLAKYAPELSQASSLENTVGIEVPSAVMSVPRHLPITAPGRPGVMPATISDGVPKDPGAAASPVAYSTLGHSAGQSVPGVVPRGPARWPIVAAAAVGMVAALVVVVLVIRDKGGEDEKPAPPSGAVDVGARPDPEPVEPTTSALAIVAEPAGAVITIDDVERGVSPLNLSFPVGARVVVRAELPGHVRAEEVVTIAETPSAVRLVLAPIADAQLEPPIAKGESDEKKDRRRRERPRREEARSEPMTEPRPDPTSEKKADPEGKRPFNPDDAAGD